MSELNSLTVTVLIPCLNDSAEIGDVIRAYREELKPTPRVIVVDNCSTKETIERARAAGAEIIVERRRGKAQAIISALPLIDSDVLILAPSDATFPVEGARRLLEFYRWEQPDMVVGLPKDAETERDFRHRVIKFAFGHEPEGLTSQLRLLSRFFYKNIPILTREYPLEVELTIQALDKNFRMASVPVPYRKPSTGPAQPAGLGLFGRMLGALTFLLSVLREYKPMLLFGGVALMFATAGLVVGSVPIYEYFTTWVVRRLSMPVLAASLMIIAFFTSQIGVVLESSLRYRRETYQTQLRRQYEGPAGG